VVFTRTVIPPLEELDELEEEEELLDDELELEEEELDELLLEEDELLEELGELEEPPPPPPQPVTPRQTETAAQSVKRRGSMVRLVRFQSAHTATLHLLEAAFYEKLKGQWTAMHTAQNSVPRPGHGGRHQRLRQLEKSGASEFLCSGSASLITRQRWQSYPAIFLRVERTVPCALVWVRSGVTANEVSQWTKPFACAAANRRSRYAQGGQWP